MLAEFDELVKKRDALVRWWKLGSKIAEYDNARHVLRVDMREPTLVSYCGQAYAGAQNYHDAPKWFAACIRDEQQARFREIATAAYEKSLANLNEQIEQHRAAVEKALAACRASESPQ